MIDSTSGRVGSLQTSKGLWIFAAAIALMVHLGVAALAYVRMQQAADDELGSPGIEVGIELASLEAVPVDLPPGPDSEASKASPAVQQQKAAVTDVDLPQEEPVESETPDRLVTVEKMEKSEEPDPTLKSKETKVAEQSIAQDATANPTVPDAAKSQRSVTPDPGVGQARQRVRVTWQKELLAHLDKHKKYPPSRHQKAAELQLSLTLNRMGHVVAVSIARGSGDDAFDAAALEMVHRASPVPPPPPLVADEGLNFNLPVVYRLGGKR